MDRHRRYGSALRTARIRIVLPILLAGPLMIAAWLETAGAQEDDTQSGPHSLAGWWLSVENFWPRLRNEAGAAVFEELLIVDDDGTVENRAVFFQLPGEEACLFDPAQPCSDAQLIATDADQNDLEGDRWGLWRLDLVEVANDPNTGLIPYDRFGAGENVDGYVQPYTKEWDALKNDIRYSAMHFGGTASPSQVLPEIGPFYLEMEEYVGMMNFGGGNGQLDLVSMQLDWAQ